MFWNKKKIAVLRLDGVIGSVGMRKKGLNLESCEKPIEEAFESGKHGVALLMNSLGGSPVQSSLIYKKIKGLKEKHNVPVWAFVEDVAASGGYYIACAADEIIIDENSVVGSIGVISAGFGFTEAIDKLGVQRRVYTSGKNKSIPDPFSPEKQEDIDLLLSLQKRVHGNFIAVVKASRINPEDEEIFSGKFWAGQDSVEKGLADSIGCYTDVLKHRFGENVKFIKIETEKKGFLERRLGLSLNFEAALDSLEYRMRSMLRGQSFGG